MRYLVTIIAVLIGLQGSIQADQHLHSATEIGASAPVTASLISNVKEIAPGQSFLLGVKLDMQQHWHTYWVNPGDSGMPPNIEWHLPEGFKIEQVLWPYPEKFQIGDLVSYGYKEHVLLFAKVHAPASLKQGEQVAFGAEVTWVACAEECLPGVASLSLNLPIASIQIPNESSAAFFAQSQAHLPQKRVMTAVRQDGKIRLQLEYQDASQFPIQKVQFFPEQQGMIDVAVEPQINWHSESEKQICEISLPIDASGEAACEAEIHGILVLQDISGKKVLEVVNVSQVIEDRVSSVVANSLPSALASSNEVGGLTYALLFALIGGLILNLMPCVLPVVSLKILNFVSLSQSNRITIIKHGAYFSFGVILSFWVLSIFMIILQTYGRSVGWGFQLQEPLFVAGMAILLFVLGLSLFGVFEVGYSLQSHAGQWEQQKSSRGDITGSFFSGVLATAIATPCTGPFLGPVVGFAATQPAISSVLIFTAMGIGMSLPYMLFSLFPSLVRFLPKPGQWMITFKQLMGFIMMASVIWLTWVFAAQTSQNAVFLLLWALLLVSVGCWIYGHWMNPSKSLFKQPATLLSTLFFVGLGGYMAYGAASQLPQPSSHSHISAHEGWEKFSEERVAKLTKEGKPVFVDFTARWCVLCQFNRAAFNADVLKRFEQAGVVKMEADWTQMDDSITQALAKQGRNGVPLYLLYKGKGDPNPLILPQTLTPQIVLEYLDKIEQKQ